MLMTQTATFIRRGSSVGVDDLGEPIYSPEAGVDVPAWYEPAGSSEDTAAAEQVVTGYTVYVPNWVRSEFAAADRVVLDFDPVEFEVVGEIGFVPDGFIAQGYCVARLERVQG